MPEIKTGRVKWYNDEKGYGFISQDNGPDVFVHSSQIERGYLSDGDRVEFSIGQGKKGPQAEGVRVLP